MSLLVALVFSVLFGSGVHLMVRRDLVRVVAGTMMISNAAILLLVSAGFSGREAPILPAEDVDRLSDPLVQALALTAVVIAFGASVLLLRVAFAVERTHGTLGVDEIVRAEQEEGRDPERGEEG